jgi:YidC/Oxa1 family membrane protein insertase
MTELWNALQLQPMLNFLILMSHMLFSNFGLAIIFLTIIVRLVMLPLTLRQIRSTRAMTTLQPKLQEIQKKCGKDKQKLQQEVSKLYKEAGVNPLGCLWPMLIQLPIWIALYQSVLRALAASPEDLLHLSQNLYPLSVVHQAVPMGSGFLWLNLAIPDSFYIMPILVGGTMWIQQKMMTAPTTDPRQQSMSKTMLWMMPLMFAFFTMQFPTGLALFWLVSNIIGIVMQYFITGWGGLEVTVQRWKAILTRVPAPLTPAPVTETSVAPATAPEEELAPGEARQEKRPEHGKSGDKRKDRRGRRRTRPKRTRRSS